MSQNCLIFFFLALLVMPSTAASRVQPESMVVCPYHKISGVLSRQAAHDCKPIVTNRLDPQGRQIWVFATINITKKFLDQTTPLGMFVSAKASSEVYLNGRYLGSNGTPSSDRETEIPGLMDSVIYVPTERLTLGENEIALRMSSHHGFLSLTSPVHYIGLAKYANPTTNNLSHYWPSLLPFGALLIGAFYMGMLALVRRNHWSKALLPLMSLIGAIQLYAEVLRGLMPYSYPIHDLRLVTILVCSLSFGLCLAGHIIWSLDLRHKAKFFLSTLILTLSAIIISAGFDRMSAFALFVPATISLALAVSRLQIKERQTLSFTMALGLFLLCLLLSPSEFLNFTFFYLVAALLVILFINEILIYAEERRERLDEKARAEKLQTVLERNQQLDTSESINVGSTGKFEVVSISKIIYCKGAGDYTELILTDGRSLLHSDGLTDLEKALPSKFLRVHRSYIVNSTLIHSLTRKPSGIGELILSCNHTVPVSRRIMPSVRDKLA